KSRYDPLNLKIQNIFDVFDGNIDRELSRDNTPNARHLFFLYRFAKTLTSLFRVGVHQFLKGTLSSLHLAQVPAGRIAKDKVKKPMNVGDINDQYRNTKRHSRHQTQRRQVKNTA